MPAGHPWWAPEMPSGWVPPPRFGETTRLFTPAPTAEGGPTIRTLCRTKAAHSPRTQAPWGRPVSIPQCLETDRKQTVSPGVTAGFRFPRRHSRFPDECSCSGNAAEGLPFLLPRRCRGRRGRLVGCGPEALERGPSRGRRRPVTRPRQRPPLRRAAQGKRRKRAGGRAGGARRKRGLRLSAAQSQGRAGKPEVRPEGAPRAFAKPVPGRGRRGRCTTCPVSVRGEVGGAVAAARPVSLCGGVGGARRRGKRRRCGVRL